MEKNAEIDDSYAKKVIKTFKTIKIIKINNIITLAWHIGYC